MHSLLVRRGLTGHRPACSPARLPFFLPRWESATAAQPWVGQHLPAVTVDSWGRFPFVLVRLLDRSNRHKVLVRGKNGAEEGTLFAQLEQEVRRLSLIGWLGSSVTWGLV